MPGEQINSDSKMEALEIEEELCVAIAEAGPEGLTFKDGCEIIGMDYDRFYLLVHRLVEMGRVKIERSRHGNQNRIFLPQQEPPVNTTLTLKQREVLDFLCSKADDEAFVSISYTEIAKHTGCSCPAFTLDRLDYKGFLEVRQSGRGSFANLYRVYPKQNGPRGYSWPRPTASPRS